MTHRRAPPTVYVSLENLRAPPGIELDPLHQSKIVRSMTGKSPIALTRLPTDWITGGFYRWDARVPHHFTEPGAAQFTSTMVSRIRGGHRPEVEVYWSPINPKDKKFVSPDAEAVLRAYQDVGLRLIPVRILDCKASQLSESAVLIYEMGKNTGFAKTIAVDRTVYASIIGHQDVAPVQAMERLIKACLTMESAIDAFHRPYDDIIYHQTIRAQVSRHREVLNSIRMLLEAGRADHCLAMVRLLYEGFLNHYLDWLSPEFFGPRLHALSEFRRFQARERLEGRICKDDKIRAALRGLLPLLETVEQKARLSPLGALFHTIAYPPLSFIVHQDYGEKAYYVDSGGDADDPVSREQTVANWADAITGALFTTIEGDIVGLS